MSNPSTPYCLEQLLDPAFEQHAGKIALSQGGRSWTYAELDATANRVANWLLEHADTRSERFIGISSAVTMTTVASVLGILRAGFAYVPLDVLSPPARLRQIVADAGLRTLLLDPWAYPECEGLCGIAERIACIAPEPEADRADLGLRPWASVLEAGASRPARCRPALHDELAYVLYTSGSTGVPKGVMLTHRNAMTFVRWMAEEFEISPSDRVAARSPLNFDFSVFDIFDPLMCGATLVLEDMRRSHSAKKSSDERHRGYVKMLREERATVLYATPSSLTVLLERGGLDADVPLRLVMYAGEPFHPAMLRRFMTTMPRTRVANIYGPTETNIVTCYWVDAPPEGPVPIGREVADTSITVVDHGRECGVEEEGEIWVHGGTVCIGYLGKPELTEQRSVQSPFHSFPFRYWRTGDQGKRLRDGNIAYLGRRDDMVKTRGYRVEIGDVEAALSAIDGVQQGIVLHQPDERYGATLHAFITAKDGAELESAALLEQLGALLPAYMVPRDLRILDSFPYTSTGKVDRQLLKSQHLCG